MAKSPDGPKYVTVNGEQYETDTFTHGGVTYTMRELSVKEQDDAEDASKQPDGSSSARLGMRLSLQMSLVEPSVSVEAMEKWPGKRYLLAARCFNKLNYLTDTDEGKA